MDQGRLKKGGVQAKGFLPLDKLDEIGYNNLTR